MAHTRDANQGAGIESGLSMKKPITDALAGLGKPKPTSEGKGRGWPTAPTEAMGNGHKFKNG